MKQGAGHQAKNIDVDYYVFKLSTGNFMVTENKLISPPC